jgi:uncharacterized membrane protein
VTSQSKFIIFTCVVVMTLGQVLFKQVAINYNKIGNLFDYRVVGLLIIAGLLYVTSTGLWVWALRSVAISKAYPYFALGFVFVPLMGAWMFDEVLSLRYAIGVSLIIAGVVMTSSA